MLEHCRPEEVNVDPAGLARFLEELKRNHLHVHSVMMLRHGKVFLDFTCAPWRREDQHLCFSLSKSFTSTAAGFAAQDGLLSVDDKIIDYFPEYLTNPPCENMKKVTIKHALTMNTGHEIESGRYGENWERQFVQSYVAREPGTYFMYNTSGTYMVAAIVEKVTGKKLPEYLNEKLFEPLGMSGDVWVEESSTGFSDGGHGMNARIEDIAKLGQFYLQKGKWDGKQLLNEQWIQDAQTPWTDNSQYLGGGQGPDWRSGYGYQFWMCTEEHAYRADGAGGQYAVICPDQDMVIAMTGGHGGLNVLLQSIWTYIFPGLDSDAQSGGDALTDLIRNPVTTAFWEESGEAAADPVPEKEWVGAYQMQPDNFLLYDQLEIQEDRIRIRDTRGKDVTVPLCRDTWQNVCFRPEGVREDTYLDHIAVRSARIGERLVLHIAYTRTAFEDMLYLSFREHGLVIDGRRNMGIGDQGYRMVGYRQ